MGKPRIAFFEFTSCEGCQLTVVDALQDHPDLLDAVEIVQFREAMSERDDDYQIAFIEGSCSRPSDEVRINGIREQADIVIPTDDKKIGYTIDELAKKLSHYVE